MQVSTKGNGKRWISSADAAKKLGINVRTLANWRTEKRGPVYKTQNGRIVYDSTSVSNHIRTHGANHNYFAQPSRVVLNWRAPQTTPQSADL